MLSRVGGLSELNDLEPTHIILKMNRLCSLCVCFLAAAISELCPVFGSSWKVLSGHASFVASMLVSKGTSPVANQLQLTLGLPLRPQSGLRNFRTLLYDPASSNYRKFLSPDLLPPDLARAVLALGGFTLMNIPIFQGGTFLLIQQILSRKPGLMGFKRGSTAQRDLAPQLRFSGLRFTNYPKRSIT